MAVEIAPIVMDANTLTSIISNLNSIYNNLINYTVGIILVVGAIIPAAISFFQNRGFRKEQIEIKNQINSEISKSIIEMEIRLKEIVNNELKEVMDKINLEIATIKSEFQIKNANTTGRLFHLQANQNDGYPEVCIPSCLTALENYIIGEEEDGVRRILFVIEVTLNRVNKIIFENSEELKKNLTDIEFTLSKNNRNGKYSMDIEKLKNGIKDAKKREPASN